MTSASGTFTKPYMTFVGVALLTGAIVAAAGYSPTKRLSTGEGVGSMVAGCGISWIASCVGAVPLAWAIAGRGSADRVTSILMATGVRFLVVLFLVVPAVFSGWFERTVLVLWVAISYLVMLGVDTLLAIRLVHSRREN